MKTKLLLIAISIITLLFFSSCDKDEMDKAGGAGGGELPSAEKIVSVNDPIIAESNNI